MIIIIVMVFGSAALENHIGYFYLFIYVSPESTERKQTKARMAREVKMKLLRGF